MKRFDQTFILTVVSDGANVTIAHIAGAGSHMPADVDGHAKLCPGDTYDFDTGVMLATTRALRALADKLEPDV